MMNMKRLHLLLGTLALLAVSARADVIGTTSSTVVRANVTDSDLILRVNDGGVAKDAVKITGSTGLVTLGASGDTAGVTANGAVSSTVGFRSGLGSSSAAAYAITGDLDTGMYSSQDGVIDLTANGTQTLTVSAGAAYVNGVLYNGAGAALSPSISFTGDGNTGLYNSTTDTLAVATNGVLRLDIDTTDVVSTLPFRGQDGSAGAPAVAFSGDTDTGIYRSAMNTVGLSAGGTLRGSINATALTTTVPVYSVDGDIGGGTYAGVAFASDPDTGISRVSSDTLGLVAGGTIRAFVDSNGLGFNSGDQVQADTASAAAPGVSFNGDLDTGFFHPSANQIGFSTSGTNRMTLTTTALNSDVGHFGPDGTASAPTYGFSDDPNTGIYSAANDNITFTTGGAEIAEMDASTFRVAGKIGANATATSYLHTVLDTFSSANGFGLRIQDTDTAATATNVLANLDYAADDNVNGAYFITLTDSDGMPGWAISTGANTVSWASASDGRLKKNVRPMADGLERLRRIKPVYFNWISDDAPGEGYIAQELREVVPEAVTGDPNGDVHTAPMGVEAGKVTPVLTAAMQELLAKVEALEARAAASEAEFAAYKAAHP